MDRNELYRIYGTDFKDMTLKLLEAADLAGEIAKKAESIGKKVSDMYIGIKPNLVTITPADMGGTTHPEIVAGIIEYLRSQNICNVCVMEGSWVGDKTAEAFEICGFNRLAQNYGIQLIDLQKDSYHEVDCKGMKIKICDELGHVDFLINVPVLKGHGQTRITCALKNMKGLIPNSEKRRFHTLGLHEPIAHLNTAIQQDFIVIDHICGDPDFEDGGNPLVRNCIMAGKDPVLVDAYTCKVLGYKTEDVRYIGLAEELGVGSADLEQLEIKTVAGEEYAEKEAVPLTKKIFELNIAVDEVDSCSACHGMLIAALDRIKAEGKLETLLEKMNGRICIGQGYKKQTGEIGIGNCTSNFHKSVVGCPPSDDEIYDFLMENFFGAN